MEKPTEDINKNTKDNNNTNHISIIEQAAIRVYNQLKTGHNERIYHKLLYMNLYV